MKNLPKQFIEITKGHDLFPPINNIPLFSPRIIGHLNKEYYQDTSPTPYLVLMKEGEESILFTSEMKFKNVARDTFLKYWKDTDFLQKNRGLADKCISLIDELYKKATPSYVASVSEEELLLLAKKALEENRNLNTFIWFTIYFDKGLAKKHLSELKTGISEERFEEIWPKAEDPTLGSFEKSRLFDVLGLIASGASWDSIAERCQYFFANYPGVDSVKESYKKIREEYGNITPDMATDLLQKEKNEEERKVSKFSRWFATLQNDEERKFVHYTQEIIRVRDARKNAVSKTLTIIGRIALQILSNAGIPEEMIKYYSASEVLLGKEYLVTNKEDFLRRKEGVAMMYFVDESTLPQIEFVEYEKAKKMLLENYDASISDKVKRDIREFKGQVACAGGVIRGVVKVIHDPKNADDFNFGDILVTSMTRPEFVPLMKKAAAIITNEGGIASHAAIVSRELKVPCITGTKIATKILKTGDSIEVDTNTGTISILK